MNATANPNEPAILVDQSKNIFKVARRNFVDPEILAAERERIFERSWLYLGHGSEIAKPGDFVTRNVAGRGILFTRDARGGPRAILNTCPHRGMQVCREKKGSAKSFQCFYHGWIFGLDGKLRSQPGEEGYNEDFKTRETSHMTPVPRFESLPRSLFRLVRSATSCRFPTTWLAQKNTSIWFAIRPVAACRSRRVRKNTQSGPIGSF